MDADAILTAVEEVLLGTLGTVRTVAAGTFERRAYEGLDITAAARALEVPRFEVEVTGQQATGVIGPRTSNVGVERVHVLVRFLFPTEHELVDDERRATRADALEKVRDARLALEWPPNLVQTVAGAPTGLVSGCLVAVPAGAKVIREDWKKRLYEVELAFEQLVRTTQPVS